MEDSRCLESGISCEEIFHYYMLKEGPRNQREFHARELRLYGDTERSVKRFFKDHIAVCPQCSEEYDIVSFLEYTLKQEEKELVGSGSSISGIE